MTGTNDGQHKSHDRGYRKLLSFGKIFEQLIQGYVDKDWKNQLDFSKSKRIDKSFVLPGYEEIESDIIYEVPILNQNSNAILIFLIEHQSSVDYAMPFRVLGYLVQIWTDFYKNSDENYRRSKKFRLPPVFPIVLYSGEQEWTAAQEVIEIVESGKLFANYIPNVKYHLINVPKLNVEQLEQIDNTLAGIFLLEKEIGSEKFAEILRKSLNVIEKETDDELWKAVVEWIFIKLKGKHPSSLPELWKNIDLENNNRKEVITMLETMPEKLFADGKKEGIREGKEEGIKEIALNMLKKGISLEDISEYTGFSIEYIQNLIQKDKK